MLNGDAKPFQPPMGRTGPPAGAGGAGGYPDQMGYDNAGNQGYHPQQQQPAQQQYPRNRGGRGRGGGSRDGGAGFQHNQGMYNNNMGYGGGMANMQPPGNFYGYGPMHQDPGYGVQQMPQQQMMQNAPPPMGYDQQAGMMGGPGPMPPQRGAGRGMGVHAGNYNRNNSRGNFQGQHQGRGGAGGYRGGYSSQPPQQQQPQQQQQQQQQQQRASPNQMGGGSSGSMGATPYQNRTQHHTPLPPPPNAAMVNQSPPMQQHQPQQQHQSPLPPQVPVPSYAKEPAPKVIMVTGYRGTGKTTVSKEIAESRGYEYISLAPRKVKNSAAKSDDGEEYAEEDEEYNSLAERFAPLTELLARKDSIKGIVIDDALINNKFEPYYVVFMLEKAGLHLDYLVVITSDLSQLVARDVTFDTAKQRKAHPESFEFGEMVETHNANRNESTPIAVIDGEPDLDTVVQNSLAELKEVEGRGLPPLELPEVNFIPNCTLVNDPELIDNILAAECAALGQKTLPYGFPYSSPNYLLEYALFSRHALHLKSYLIVPWIWGDRVSVIGYGDGVYVHLPSYRIVFQLKDVPAPMMEALAHLNAEAAAAAASNGTALTGPSCVFSLEATMLNSVIYIADMMVFGSHSGANMLLMDRVKLLKEHLGKLPTNGPLRLLEHYKVSEITKCLNANADIARGVVFVNPDGMQVAAYDSRNFTYPSEEAKSVKVRIWSGRLDEDAQMWTFDAFAMDGQEDSLIGTMHGSFLEVHISDDDVNKYSVNDGDIVECTEEQCSSVPQQRKSNKKGGKAQNTTTVKSYLAFQRRCEWEVSPTLLYSCSAILDDRTWPTERFITACHSIKYHAPTVAADK